MLKNLLLEIIAPQGTSWAKIREEVSRNLPIKNWMLVRGELQLLVNKNIVRRGGNISNEIYHLNK